MKTKLSAIIALAFFLACENIHAQNTFPSTGRAGIYTTSPVTSLQVKGGARIGTTANYVNIDSATGSLTFAGTGVYKVAGNKYAFQFTGNPHYGLFFNSTAVQYEFRNGSAVPVFSVNANTGNSIFNGTLKVGAYTLPATDGTNGQVLKTNGSGVLTWSNADGGSGWLLTGNTGTNPATNFIGTTDDNPLNFRVNNTNAGTIQTDGQIFLGFNAGVVNTGLYNTAVGGYALQSNTSGSYNTADGNQALDSNTTGIWNTATGFRSLYSNTTGQANTANGESAMYSNATGNYNTAIGLEALYYDSTGSGNSAIGQDALFNNISGDENTANGTEALSINATGSYNTADGFFAGPDVDGLSNTTAIGENAITTADNQVRVGNNEVTSIGGYVDWSNISDGRVKKNIKQNVPGLIFINKLQPVTYNLNLDAADKIIQRPIIKDKSGKAIQLSQFELDSRKAKEQIIYTGFVAQDVEKAAKSLNYDFSGVDAAKNDKDLYGLRYAEFVVPLVKGEQELSKENDSLKSIVSSLQNQINELKSMIISNQSLTNNQSAVVLTNTNSLQQNIPNPFSHVTTIGYSLSQKFTSAQIVITDKNGKTIKAINISNGKGNVTVDASTLASGAYQYSLIVDGRLMATKQMVLAK